MTISEFLKRGPPGESWAALARTVGVSVASVTGWRSGKKLPEWEHFLKLAAAYSVEAETPEGHALWVGWETARLAKAKGGGQ